MSEFASTGNTEEVVAPVTTPVVSEAKAAPKFVSAADLFKKTRDAEKETRERYDSVYSTIVDDIVGDEENLARLMRDMERSADRGYTKKVLRKFGFVPRSEGEEMPTHDEKGVRVVYEIEDRKYFLLSVLNKGGKRFFPMLSSRFGKGYWCDFYRDPRDGSINIFVSWAPRQENTRPRPPRREGAPAKEGSNEKKSPRGAPRPQGPRGPRHEKKE